MNKYLTILIFFFLLIGTSPAQDFNTLSGSERLSPEAVEQILKDRSPEKIDNHETKSVHYRFENKNLDVEKVKRNGEWEIVSGTLYEDSDLFPIQPLQTEEPQSEHLGFWILFLLFTLVGAVPGWVLARLYSRGSQTSPKPAQDLSDLTYPEAAAVVFLSMRPEECGELACHLGEEKLLRLKQVLQTLDGVGRGLAYETVRFFASQFELEPWEASRVWSERPDLAAELLSEWLLSGS
jgi:hypothetical protein